MRMAVVLVVSEVVFAIIGSVGVDVSGDRGMVVADDDGWWRQWQ